MSLFADWLRHFSAQNTPSFVVVVILVKAKYEEAQGMSLHKAISKEFRGDLKTALQVRQCGSFTYKYQAGVLAEGF